MFNKETVFVIGAGASCELGFPTGPGLKRQIANYLNVRHQHSGQLTVEDEELVQAFSLRTHEGGLDEWFSAARRVSAGMSIAPSIDNYLHTHSDNTMFARCGKLAIVGKILDSERRSPLFGDGPKSPELAHEKLHQSWLPRFAWQLVVDAAKYEAAHVFQRLHFVIFNYDRCVEHYLYYALQAYYDLTTDEAAAILNTANFYHPYGTVGKLPWQDGAEEIAEFGEDPNAAKLLTLSDGIRTFTESIESDDYLAAARQAYLNSKQVIFLGFSFGRQNMRLLTSPLSSSEAMKYVPLERRIYGTSYGVSEDDQTVFQSRIKKSWPSASHNDRIDLHNLTCAALFDRYSQSIAG